MEADKSGKVKMTFELEINESAMDLMRQNASLVSELIGQAAQNWREEMDRRRREGGRMGPHGMGMMHHGPPE